MRPKSPAQLRDALFRQGWHPGIVFYEESKRCRSVPASLIRASLSLFEELPSTATDIWVLVHYLRGVGDDKQIELSWQRGIDALRMLYGTSPIGTERERNKLIQLAADAKFVDAMLAVVKQGNEPAPNWLAVFAAKATPECLSVVERTLAHWNIDRLTKAIPLYRGALDTIAPLPGATKEPSKPAQTLDDDARPMNRSQFWELIASARDAVDPVGALTVLLQELAPKHVTAFARHFDALLDRAYRWDLWGAVYLRFGGCSDDHFRDFRAALIMRGETVFDAILISPDMLAEHSDIEADESSLLLAEEVYEEMTGHELPVRSTTQPSAPRGSRFDFDDEGEMKRRYPKLFKMRSPTTR